MGLLRFRKRKKCILPSSTTSLQAHKPRAQGNCSTFLHTERNRAVAHSRISNLAKILASSLKSKDSFATLSKSMDKIKTRPMQITHLAKFFTVQC